MHIMVVVKRNADLFEIVAALSASGSFASRLNSRQQQRDQNRNDGDHDEQFDERKADASLLHAVTLQAWLGGDSVTSPPECTAPMAL